MEECKRSRTRTPYCASATATFNGTETSSGKLHDISLEGLYVLTDKVVDQGREVKMKIALHGVESVLSIDIPATVVRTDEKGFAVRFHHPLEWWPVFSLFPLHQLDNIN